MADLLDSLEAGITRAVGAASRLRSQIATIDTYLTAQRQHELLTNGPPYHQSALPNPPVATKHELNPNIDPNLQNAVPSASLPSAINVSAPLGSFDTQNSFDYTTAVSSNSLHVFSGPADEQLQFHLPPELLENWPWNLDMNQGFMQGSGGWL